MKTQMILYRQDLIENGKFSITPDYGWEISGPWTINENSISKAGSGVGILSQSGLLVEGIAYRLKFRIYNGTTGNVTITNSVGGTSFLTANSNQIYVLDFTADGPDMIFNASSAWDGTISMVSLTQMPDKFYLDLTDDVSVPMNFNIDSIFNINQRKTAFSKTITLPGTHNNNLAFQQAYKINNESLFKPIKPSRCVVKNEGIVLFDGTLILDDTQQVIGNNSSAISYDVQLIGESFNIFDKLGTLSIKDLDFSRYDHPFNLGTIRLNWPSFQSSTGISPGIAYIWDSSTMQYVPNQTVLYTSPAVISVTSAIYKGNACVLITFASAHSFAVDDGIYIDCDNHSLCGTQTVAAVPSATTIVLNMAFANFSGAPITVIKIDKRQWDAVGYWYPMMDNGHYCKTLSNTDQILQGNLYTITFLDGVDDFTNIAKDPVTGLAMTQGVGLTFLADNGSSIGSAISPASWIGASTLQHYDLKDNGATLVTKNNTANHWNPLDFIPCVFAREVFNKMFSLIDYYYDCPLMDTDLFRRLVIPMDTNFDQNQEFTAGPLIIGHKYQITNYVTGDNFTNVGAPSNTNYAAFIATGTTPTNWANLSGITELIRMNDYLPDMLLSDFFISVLNMFNLVIIEDKQVKNLVRLVSRNKFSNGNKKYIKLNSEQSVTVTTSVNLIPNHYILKYKDSSDFYNTAYKTDFGFFQSRTYGDKYIYSGNEINKNDSVVELAFEPTVMAGKMLGQYDKFNPGYGNDKVFSVTYTSSDGITASRKNSNRILIAGVRGTNDPWSFADVNPAFTDESFDVRIGANLGRQYPYAQHLDNVYDAIPRYDINFDYLLGKYWDNKNFEFDNASWSANCLAGQNWDYYLAQLLNYNLKQLQATIRLSAIDIYNLDFQDDYYFQGTKLRLNQVVDWDLNSDGVCSCIFLTL